MVEAIERNDLLEQAMYLVWLTNLGLEETAMITGAAQKVLHYAATTYGGDTKRMTPKRVGYARELAKMMKVHYGI